MELIVNDANLGVASFWKRVVEDPSGMIRHLRNVPNPRVSEFDEIHDKKDGDADWLGFRSLFLNRTSFSGLGHRPIGGREQRHKDKWHVGCRYNVERLCDQLAELHHLLGPRKISITQEKVSHLRLRGSIYADPPYVEKGGMLYDVKMTDEDHRDLAKVLRSKKNWLLSYDDCDLVRDLYDGCERVPIGARYSVNGKKDGWISKSELLIMAPGDLRVRKVLGQVDLFE